MRQRLFILVALIALIGVFAACAPAPATAPESAPESAPPAEPTAVPPAEPEAEEAPEVGMANPASEYCVEQGGTLEIRQGEGGETGYCVFADGSECEEWAYFRGECTPGQAEIVFTDPFEYCAAVGTIDIPDSRYAGSQPPEAVIQGLRAAFDTPADAPDDIFTAGTSWRCAEGKVKGCFVGANLPCNAQADLSETPSDAVTEFCAENPDAEVVPASVTGRETVYSWRCAGDVPEIEAQVFTADAQGFISEIWYEIEPAAAATGPYMPVPADVCEILQADAENALSASFAVSEAPFFDYVNQEGGAGCVLTAEGTGVDFANPAEVVDALTAAFVGWEEAPAYQAGGPAGMGTGMTRDAALLLILAEWTPAPEANCPDDQPISACELTPEQQLYTVTVQAAMK